MAQINISNLTFFYDGNPDIIFDNVSFYIDTDWKLGFVGRNGRGKTTFLKLLMRKYEFKGDIIAPIKFDYFPFEVENPHQSAYEIAEQLMTNCEKWILDKELNLLNVDMNCRWRAFSSLSGGEQTKILLAILFARGNNFLLIDEPTNHLDKDARKAVSNYLQTKKGFIVVSHDRDLLDACTDHTLSINKTNIEVQDGNFSCWLENKQRHDSFELAQNDKLENEIERLKQAARRKTNWSHVAESKKKGASDKGFMGAKAARQMKTAKIIERRQNDAINEKAKLLRSIEKTEQLTLSCLPCPAKYLVSANGLTITRGNKRLFQPLNFAIMQGDRIAICGKNGVGKTSLLKFIANMSSNPNSHDLYNTNLHIKHNNNSHSNDLHSNNDVNNSHSNDLHSDNDVNNSHSNDLHSNDNCNSRDNNLNNDNSRDNNSHSNLRNNDSDVQYDGLLHVQNALKISYIAQDTSQLSGTLKQFAQDNNLDETLFFTNLFKLGFKRNSFSRDCEKDISTFSAGQKKKVLIAKSISESAHLYIWDEPLNYIDVLSRIQIEQLLCDNASTLIFTEHDQTFIEKIATKTILLN